jgi:AAA15 family ATPase/GTPase
MLKKIKLDNYVTFTKSTEIDFTATNYKFLESENVGSNKLLKGCLFVGENASGKTKILSGITFLLDLLFGNKEVDFMTNKSFYTDKKTYKIEYTFIQENVEIIYLIEIGLNEIVSEKLVMDKKIILERLGNTAKFLLNDEKTFTDISNKLLFLRRIYFDTNFYEDKVLINWFNYMKKSVYINCYYRNVVTYSGENLLVHEYLNDNTVDEINKFLEKINYNQKIEYGTEISDPNHKFSVKSNDNKKFISFNKSGTDIYVPEMFESTGNKTFMELLPSFLHAINNECMIIIDEFSSGFHNELEECIIKYFFHYSNNSQLFFTSHSTNILNNSLLRPDQIYSVYFDSKKGSQIKRFSDEMPRESQNTEKMYLNGVFNGLPRYNKVFKD